MRGEEQDRSGTIPSCPPTVFLCRAHLQRSPALRDRAEGREGKREGKGALDSKVGKVIIITLPQAER